VSDETTAGTAARVPPEAEANPQSSEKMDRAAKHLRSDKQENTVTQGSKILSDAKRREYIA
jgi:hypothetical protein